MGERPLSYPHQKQFQGIIGVVLLLAVAAYSSFFLYGYRPAQFGGIRLPALYHPRQLQHVGLVSLHFCVLAGE
ncbi:MAG: hypothetical protein M5U34_16500 [Chloroflexi bacterium]|nr:hypothetical protein [Chloroflexota bacterium]